jgi:hypothetical protein
MSTGFKLKGSLPAVIIPDKNTKDSFFVQHTPSIATKPSSSKLNACDRGLKYLIYAYYGSQ